jgi:hypothetical protein
MAISAEVRRYVKEKFCWNLCQLQHRTRRLGTTSLLEKKKSGVARRSLAISFAAATANSAATADSAHPQASFTIFFTICAADAANTANDVDTADAATLPTPTPVAQPAPPSPPTFRTPQTPPPTGKLPTPWRKVLCRECHQDSHDISYRHCIKCHFKENGYPSYYHDM